MRVLITGSSGMLGKDVAELFAANPGNQVYALNRGGTPAAGAIPVPVDLTKPAQLEQELQRIRPELIIHCAALVNVDACEENRSYARQLHVESTEVLASHDPSARLLYISTDSVFDGSKGNYTEQDTPRPLNYYAQSKLEGEHAALASANALVIRTNLYGFHRPRTSGSLVEWALQELAAGKSVSGFTDVTFNPLYSRQLAQVVLELSAHTYKGVVNAAASESQSNYSFLVALSRLYGFEATCVKAASVDETTFKARRPKNTTLSTTLLNTLLGEVPDFNAGLRQLRDEFNI